MNSYFAKQPILDLNGETYGYELLYRNTSLKSSYDGVDGDKSTADIINSVFFDEDYSSILKNKRAFLNFTENLLIEKAAMLLPKEQIVVEVLETVMATDEILECCAELKENGYIIALDDYVYTYETAPLLDYCDIVKIDFRGYVEDIEYTAQRCRERNLILLAEKIETIEEAEYAKSLGCTLMQGYYFAQPFIMIGSTYSPMASTFIRLINAVKNEEPDMDEIASVISEDAFMTAKLLHLVNAIRSDMSEHIYSVKQALVMLGMKKLNDWIYLIGLQRLSSDGSEKRAKTALFRATFCSNISMMIFKNKKASDEAYLMGLMSVVVNPNDKNTMNKMGLSQRIIDGLMNKSGVYGDILNFAIGYELALWDKVDEFVGKYKLDDGTVFKKYIDSINRVDMMYRLPA